VGAPTTTPPPTETATAAPVRPTTTTEGRTGGTSGVTTLPVGSRLSPPPTNVQLTTEWFYPDFQGYCVMRNKVTWDPAKNATGYVVYWNYTQVTEEITAAGEYVTNKWTDTVTVAPDAPLTATLPIRIYIRPTDSNVRSLGVQFRVGAQFSNAPQGLSEEVPIPIPIRCQ
jgi:hypothetical protein